MDQRPLMVVVLTLTNRGYNLAPKSNDSVYDDAPRGAMRILNSMSTQAAFRANGGRSSEDTGERRKRKDGPGAGGSSAAATSSSNGKGKGKDKAQGKDNNKDKPTQKPKVPGIMPHESLGDYNRRVESALRAGVSQAIKSANKAKGEQAKEVKRAKEERKAAAQAGVTETETESRGTKRKHDASDAAIEFKTKEGPRRLNDIAQAPPSLPKLKVARDEGSTSVWTAKGKGKSGLSAGQERIMEVERERVIAQYRAMKAAREVEREKERAKLEGGKKGKGAKSGREDVGEGESGRQAVYESDDE